MLLKRFAYRQGVAEKTSPQTSDALEPCVAHKVLIVDGEKKSRVSLARIIAFGFPYCVLEFAAYGEAAVAVFRLSHPKIVIMDLMLPSISGVQAYHEMMNACAEKGWRPPCVIFCSRHSPSDELKKILNGNPAHHLLPKPVKPETLIDAVKQRLN